jgi:hypothetical protein
VAVAEGCEPVRIDKQALAGAVELIGHDLTATLGWDRTRAQADAWDALDTRMEVLPDDLAWEQLDPAARQEVLEDLVAEAVEQLQQRLHDTFVDTTWPACPRHRRHPLWLGEAERGGIAWCCPRDRAAIAPLGALPPPPPEVRS